MDRRLCFCFFLASCELLWPGSLLADSSDAVDAGQMRVLIEQNRRLQEEINSQEHTIEQLRTRMDAIDQSGTKNQEELRTLQDQVAANPAPADAKPADAP